MSELYEQLGLTRREYEKICSIQGREPTHVELAVFSLMWSEHCGYKHSKPLLKRFPTKGEHVLQGPGENAGIVDIGGGLAVVMKIESHNHPSAVEPYQGAATGVGGIIRDIFAMGARPICGLDSLRFGEIEPLPARPARGAAADTPPSEATINRQRYLFEQVVAGIGGYGNCMGIPTVAGEVYFEDPYAGNCLVNAMTVGLVRHDQIIRSKAAGVGNHVVLIGSKTGRDGIGGASVLASQVFDETLEEKRPSVQVGDPFTEKKLLEACLELLRRGLLVALQDLGAAGITSSSSEMAAKGGVGIDLHTDRVPLREADMEPWEIMISESQERMLCIVAPENWEAVKAVCDRWDLDATIVGKVTDTRRLRVFYHGEMVGDMDAEALAEPPTYEVPQERPAHEVDEPLDPEAYPAPDVAPGEILTDLLGSPNIASRRWIWEQYDHQVQLNTVIGPGGDAALLRVKRTGAGIAVCTDGNGRQTFLDPYRGGKAAVCEAARNVSCVGAKPIAITNCLNFGNPDNGPIAYQLAHVIEGMAQACEALGTPVISGNVSLYNESFEQPIYPTPVVGMLGVMDDVSVNCTVGFKREGDLVYLLGDAMPVLDGSEYQKRWFGGPRGRPAGRIPDVDLEAEVALQSLLREAIAARLLRSAHDCSDGGPAVAVAESCLAGKIGAVLTLDEVPWVAGSAGCAAAAGAAETRARAAGPLALRPDLALFGEAPTLVVVSIAAADIDAFEDLCEAAGVPYTRLGTVGGADLVMTVGGAGLRASVAALDEVYESALRRALGE
ncbi:MAG: phosphoribosylformylglycinamidine synthase subunit PurL [Actinomycetia bacterium]|nr:phosphoribosylformylglycinamidine synthase subunit PurL [Actinomycetes bacterium]